MSYLVLARKYRPTTFDEVIGQDGVVRTLKNAIAMERVAHAYLFTGARGVGKTTVARLLAKALNCEQGPTAEPDNDCSICQEIARGGSPDVFEIDGASNTGVDDVRQLRDNIQYLPARSRFKIYIIDEVHMLSTSAFNALLKTLEEPPAHAKFVFATTEPHKIPMTVLSRCQRFDFKRIASAAIEQHLEQVLAAEGMRIEPEGLRLIARQAGGSMRDGLSLTDQVLAFGGESSGIDQVRQALGLTGSGLYEQLIDALLDGRADDLMRLVERLFDEGHDLARFLEGLLWHVHHLILFCTLDEPAELVDLLEEERQRLRTQAERAEALRWHQMFDVLSRTAGDLARHPHPRLVLETALLRLAVIEPVVAVDELLARVEQLAGQLGAEVPGRSGPTGPGGGASPRGRSTKRPPAEPSPPRQAAPPEPAPAHRAPPPEAPPVEQPPPADEPPPPAAATAPAVEPPPPAQPAALEVPATVAAPPAEAAPGAGLDGQAAWEPLVAHVARQRPSLGSFLNHARLRRLEGEQLVIALEPGSFFYDQLRAERNRTELQQLAAGFLGHPVQLSVESLSEEDGPSLAEAKESQARQMQQEMRRQALDHPMVQEAIRVFGAEVEAVRPRSGEGDG